MGDKMRIKGVFGLGRDKIEEIPAITSLTLTRCGSNKINNLN